jgi:hypothetical protein
MRFTKAELADHPKMASLVGIVKPVSPKAILNLAKSCRFCGSDVHFIGALPELPGKTFVLCASSQCNGRGPMRDSLELAVLAWNGRHPEKP